MVKLKDVARAAGVSEATASLVLNKRPGVNTFTRERVIAAAERLGYTPNAIARNLATRRSRTIGLVVTDINNPFFGALTKFVDEYVRAEKYGLILSLSEDEIEKEDTVIEDFIGKMVEGIIIVPTLHHLRKEFDTFERLNALSIPHVFLSSYYPKYDGDSVMADLARGAYLLTKHLTGQGCREIRFLATEDLSVVPAATRLSGIKRAMEEEGLSFDGRMVIRAAAPTFEAGYEATLNHLRANSPENNPEAIMAMNDIMALGAQRAAIESGLRVPKDIAVTGYDNVIYSTISEVPLTTVNQNIGEMCEAAVRRLFSYINGESPDDAPGVHLIEPHLVIRASSGVSTAPRNS